MRKRPRAGSVRLRKVSSDPVIAERSRVYGLLGTMYLCRPTRDAIASWIAWPRGGAPGIPADLMEALEGIDTGSEQVMEDTLWEYTKLFVGPYRLPCPPWESVYTSPKRLMMQEAHDQVLGIYRQAGLELGEPGVLPDHIGAELNFMAVLWERIGEDPAKKAFHAKLAERFLEDHLRNWVPAFTRDMETAAESVFYKTLARVTRDAVSARPASANRREPCLP